VTNGRRACSLAVIAPDAVVKSFTESAPPCQPLVTASVPNVGVRLA
jgi:hypothetical protein